MKKLILVFMFLCLCSIVLFADNIKDARAYFNQGLAKYDLQDYTGAIKDFTRAIELNPKYAEAYGGRGLAKYSLKDKQGALEDLSKSGELGYSTAYDIIKFIQDEH